MGDMTRKQLLERGMSIALHAAEHPDRPAIISEHGDRTFAALNARANQLVRALRARGIAPGAGVALLCANRPEFAEVVAATLRAGYRLTTINWHLTGEEVGYIVDNCRAEAFVADARFASAAIEAAALAPAATTRLAVAGDIEGFDDYDAAIAPESADDIDDPTAGDLMLYTSGTTGRPKGVYREPGRLPFHAFRGSTDPAFDGAKQLHLLTGPLYHAAPLASLLAPLFGGVGLVLMDGWTPEECLRLIHEHRITHMHLVPVMFHRLLALPDDVKAKFDVGSVRQIVHGAAPCPVDVKQRMIEWFGPVLLEYYAATEGGATLVTSEEWLKKPGTVGKVNAGQVVEVRDEENNVLPVGEVGTIYIKHAARHDRFEYFGDPDKTAGAYDGEFFTLGDMGYFDEDSYLFLTGRSAELIISGGVNIYPAEVDAALLRHPDVADACTVGIPNREWGEEVKSVVVLKPGAGATEAELIEHCREHIAHFKCPRSIDFVESLPRLDTGKLYRRLVRDRYLAS